MKIPMTPEQKEEHARKVREGKERARQAREAQNDPAEQPMALSTEREREGSTPSGVAISRETPADEARLARRARWLAGIPADIAALITDAEIDQMEAEEHRKAEEERKRKALEQIRLSIRHEARVENDLIAASTLRSDAEKARLMRKGRIKINLPRNGSGDPKKGTNCFRVDGRELTNGQEYEVTQAEYESLLANHYGVWLHELRFSTLSQADGESARAILAERIPEFEFRPL